jgi:leucyl-tRNA synthetase
MERYNPRKIEAKWQKKWLKEKVYEPNFLRSHKPFYNLMMFPYPSAEGLHVGNMYAFVGSDIYGRFKRMQGYDVFEPIGLDGFGIHSENYALKIGKHPADQAKISEKNFYRQLQMIGNGFAWNERLETYDPQYYKWTQWIFVQMFKRGLAYRKKAAVNWCESCKTVLADEQVVSGECERCETKVIKKELEQWFFKITDYAERLLKNLEKIDWSERIKIAQKNWIGKSEGALIDFPVVVGSKKILLLHGWGGSVRKNFFPWLSERLRASGFEVYAADLPNPRQPRIEEQINFILKNFPVDEDIIVFGHSLGGVVLLKLLERGIKIDTAIIAGTPIRLGQSMDDKTRKVLSTATDWKFDFPSIKQNARRFILLYDRTDPLVSWEDGRELASALSGEYREVVAASPHFSATEEPDILSAICPVIRIFTTRPDTLFGATYMVLGPEHILIQNLKSKIQNWDEVEDYIKKAKAKSEEERIAEGKEKTGIELKGIKAINPVTKEEIPVWVADYVLGDVGTGAIMAVPAHDRRDYEFAKKFGLPVQEVIMPAGGLIQNSTAKSPNGNAKFKITECAYEGKGILINSAQFNGMDSEKAKWEITKFVGGEKKINYRLRDWLISRQRYWGPPIPMIFCESCKKRAENSKFKIKNAKFSKGELENPGWIAVPEKDLPVKLPYIKNFRPTGTEKSPLATVEKFYKVRCPKCKSWARRETDVSDTFLDSAWYYIGYLAKENSKFEILNSKFRKRARRWLPVDMYIGGAEHAVLHLLYVRFLAMAFYDCGFLHFEEPFKKFRAHGLLIKDGAKMSKSRGNVVNPDEYIKLYGTDAFRMYLMFLGPFEQGGDFRDTGIRGITRFLERVWRLIQNLGAKNSKFKIQNSKLQGKIQNDKIKRLIHQTIKKVTEDIEGLQYNTAISALMVLLNKFEEDPQAAEPEHIKTFLKLLAPFAPHLTEELWHLINRRKLSSIHKEPWPEYESRLIQEETFDLIIQVNGKVRGHMTVHRGISEDEARNIALGLKEIKRYVMEEPRKVIFVPDKLINFVI